MRVSVPDNYVKSPGLPQPWAFVCLVGLMARWNHGGRTRQQRGYDAAWLRLRAQVVREEPLCRICTMLGRVAPTDEVDHIKPFSGLDDPLRLDRDNLRGLCRDHHQQVTAASASGRRLRITGADGWPVEV